MSHSITLVENDQLPEGHDFVFVDIPAGAHIFYRRESLGERVLEDSWAAYRAIESRLPHPPVAAVLAGAQVVDLLSRMTG